MIGDFLFLRSTVINPSRSSSFNARHFDHRLIPFSFNTPLQVPDRDPMANRYVIAGLDLLIALEIPTTKERQ